MRVRNQHTGGEKIELQMTPMIDIVFQLLVFFIMTFKIAALEGDFNIQLPASEGDAALAEPQENIVLRVQMRDANGDGELDANTFRVNQKRLTYKVNSRGVIEMPELTRLVVQSLHRGDNGPETPIEVELDCDSTLRYEYIIAAITAVTGYKDQDDNLVKLAQRIRFKSQD